jgi:hypothetical protein
MVKRAVERAAPGPRTREGRPASHDTPGPHQSRMSRTPSNDVGLFTWLPAPRGRRQDGHRLGAAKGRPLADRIRTGSSITWCARPLLPVHGDAESPAARTRISPCSLRFVDIFLRGDVDSRLFPTQAAVAVIASPVLVPFPTHSTSAGEALDHAPGDIFHASSPASVPLRLGLSRTGAQASCRQGVACLGCIE